MQEKTIKRIEKQLKKIEKNKYLVSYYDIGALRDCYLRLKDYIIMIEKWGFDVVCITNVDFEIKLSNNILKNYM